MLRLIILTTFGVGLAIAAPQFLTFKDGNIGVNFGGYSAQAGLGGLLTGNAAHGGLSASAGTPWGAKAAAGLGGSVNGDSVGTAYAGAKLNDEVGASSVIGGSTGEQQKFGFAGAESHANGNAVIKTIVGAQESSSLPTNSQQQKQQQQQTSSSTATGTTTITKHVLFTKDQMNAGNVQKIKPPKKYAPETNVHLDGNVSHHKHVVKSIEETSPSSQTAARKSIQINSGILTSAFNIPIGILSSIRDNLQPISVQKQITYSTST